MIGRKKTPAQMYADLQRNAHAALKDTKDPKVREALAKISDTAYAAQCSENLEAQRKRK